MAESASEGVKQRKIVIAMDGSKHSIFAYEWFANTMHEKNDEVILVHAVEPSPKISPLTLLGGNLEAIHTLIAQQEAHEKEVMASIDTLITKFPNILPKVKTLKGHPGDAIVKEAESHNADLILVGSRGHGTVRRTMMGSVSDFIVHHSHVPVLICKHEHHLRERTSSTASS